MTNPSEVDYDKQFQEDLEKATALSLETLALEEFRRSKLQYSHSDAAVCLNKYAQNQQSRLRPGSFSIDTIKTNPADTQLSISTPPAAAVAPQQPPPAVPPRRHSEIHYPSYTEKNNSQDDDLISFASPTSTKKDENVNFDKLIEDIQRLNTQLIQQPTLQYGFGSSPSILTMTPLAASSAVPSSSTITSSSSSSLASASSHELQLVPYNAAVAANTQRTPLTNEELKKLYNMQPTPQMPFRGPYQPPHISAFIRPQQQQQQQQPNIIPIAPFNYPPPPAYGFQMHLFPSQQQQQQQQCLQFPKFELNQVQQQQQNFTINSEQIKTVQQANQYQAATAAVGPIVSVQQIPQIPKSASVSSVSSTLSSMATNSTISQGANKNVSNSSITVNNSDVVRRPKKSVGCDDLIDLGHEDSSRVSVLEAFDPLLSRDWDDTDSASDCTTSYYAEYDPFDYLYSCGTQYSDPVYEAVNKTDRTPMSPVAASIGWKISATNYQNDSISPPPLPPRNCNNLEDDEQYQQEHHHNQVLDRRKHPSKLYETVIDRKTNEPEIMQFYWMVKDLRSKYKYNEAITNVGHVIASEFNNKYSEEKSIKLLVHPAIEVLRDDGESAKQSQIPGYGLPVIFTCDVSTTVEHVIMHVFCALEGQIIGTVNDFMVKPIGVVEWLSPHSKLSQLECVHDSIKLEHDVQLGLCPKTETNTMAIARTKRDDTRDSDLKPEDILPNEHDSAITYDNMMILIETLETEIDKLELSASDASPRSILSCSGVVQGVKAICALLGSIDTIEISNCVEELKKICTSDQFRNSFSSNSCPDIISECGDYAEIALRPKTILDQIKLKCHQIRESIQELIDTYANAFRVNFCVKTYEYSSTPLSVCHVLKPIIINISCLHRPPPAWKYDNYMLGVQIYHGTRFVSDPIVTPCSNDTTGGLFPRLTFDTWISFEKNPICTLPRESRLIFVLYGCKLEPEENNESSNDANQERKQITTELGWCAIQLFDFQREMIYGTHLLSLWPPTTDKFLGPAPPKGCHPQPDFCPVLSIEIPSYGARIVFPESTQNLPPTPRLDFKSLDCNLQQELLDTAEQGYPGALDKREVFWEKRHYLQDFPHALPKVLHAAHSWDYASLMDLHSLLKSWTPLTPLQALELLLPRYPDMEVRAKAVKWISQMPNDQLVDYLPQLLQSLKHDTYEASPMANFLLCKCLESPRIAHHLYWLLVHSLPGDAPQNSIDATTAEMDESLITQARYHRRNKMMLRAVLAICGEKLLSRFLSQNMMCKNLAEVAQSVKQTKESLRQKALIQGMETVNQILLETPTSLPLGPGLEVSGVNVRGCSYFNSNTLPLKIAFLGPDRGILPAIFKCGDDLQQDMLTIQLVRIMDKLWLSEGLDLKMVTFNCVPTGYKKGMIELVTEAETLRKIQVEYGLTGSFKDRPIAEWLARQNPSQLEYQRAVDNFTVSCAGYSVATYVLGICDRHNDNIMLKTSGHLFHIDFGKFLGDAQMFGNFKRDRTPFVLTSDMAYVINGGDKPSTKFHHFVDLCCRAFNIVRKHGDLILHMLALMATAGIPGVTADAVSYVRRALLPSQSNPEAAASFAKMIQFSLKSWFTQFNFFLHNLAQLRFSTDEGNGELLSFVPRVYTMQQDGRLKSVTVHGYQKRYDLEKYYTYILKVTRQSQPDPAYLFRSYKEFLEFHQKLCLHFPLAKLHSLPSGIHVGRSNIKSVAERRLPEIRMFLVSLFNSADEIAHSDLVYTFFHPLLRDQQEANIHVSKVKEVKPTYRNENVCGEVKLSLQYRRGTLTVMIHHARGLPLVAGGQEPNTYVKCYLKPDPVKATKRKTKVIRKSCVPTFMETLEYRMPLEIIQNRILQVSVWSHDTLQENTLLGGFDLQLSKYELREELIEWFRLDYLPRSS